MPSPLTPPLSLEAPRLNCPVIRPIGRFFLRLSGWKLVGEMPRDRKLIIAMAPHTSNWDFVYAMLVLMAAGIKLSWFMKKEAFIWPVSKLFVAFGGIPLNRINPAGTVDEVAAAFRQRDSLWLAITPEGTRRKVTQWKTGFLRIAEATGAPVLIVGWDFPSKTIQIDRFWSPSGNHSEDADAIRDYVNQRFRGRHPDLQ